MVKQVRDSTPTLGSHACSFSSPFTASWAALRVTLLVLPVAACVVGDAGGPQLREASLTSAAVPAGALAAQAVLVTSVGRYQLLLRSEEKALLHGVPIPAPPSIYSQVLSFGLHGVGIPDMHRAYIILVQPPCYQGKAKAVIVSC